MVNITGWELVERLVTLYGLLLMLWQLYQNRTKLWSGMKWLAMKGFGLTASFSGAVVLGADGWAIWNFPQFLSFESASSLAGSCLGATIGAMLFGGLGLYAVLGGIWFTIPNTRLGKYVKRRFFGRPERGRRKILSTWAGLKKRVPAAGILRFFFSVTQVP